MSGSDESAGCLVKCQARTSGQGDTSDGFGAVRCICMLLSVTVSYTVSYTVCDDYMSTYPSICVRKLALGLDDAESRGRWVSMTLDLEIRWNIIAVQAFLDTETQE